MSKRIEKIRGVWSDMRLLNLPGVLDEAPERIFRAVVDADPTPQKKMLAWILDAWENNGLLWEDIKQGASSKTASTLGDFERLKKHILLPNGQPDIAARSLMQYKNPGDMWEKIAPLIALQEEANETISSRQRRKLDAAKSDLESFTATLSSGVTVTIPLSRFSAMMNGRGTRWCTAADKDNLFESYVDSGPLFIFTLPSGSKFQGHLKIRDVYCDNIFGEIVQVSDDLSEASVITAFSSINDEIAFLNAGDVPLNEREKAEIAPYLNDISGFMADTISKSLIRSHTIQVEQAPQTSVFFSDIIKLLIMEEEQAPPPFKEMDNDAYLENATKSLNDINLMERFIDKGLVENFSTMSMPHDGPAIRSGVLALKDDILNSRVNGIRISMLNDAQEIVRNKFTDVAQDIILNDEQIHELLNDLNSSPLTIAMDSVFCVYTLLNEHNIDRTLALEANRFRSGIETPKHIVEGIKDAYIPPNIGPHIWQARFGPNGWSHFCPAASISFESDGGFGFNNHFGHYYISNSIKEGASVDALIIELFNEKRPLIGKKLTEDVRHNIKTIVQEFSSVVGIISSALDRAGKSPDQWGNAQNLGIPEVKRICNSLDPSMSETQIQIMMGDVMKIHLYQTPKGRLENLRKMLGIPDNDAILTRIVSEINNNESSPDGKEYFRYWLSRTDDFNYRKLDPEIRAGLEIISQLKNMTGYESTARRGGVHAFPYYEDIADMLNIDYVPRMRRAELSASMAYPTSIVLDSLALGDEGPETISSIITTMTEEKNQAKKIMQIMSPDEEHNIWVKLGIGGTNPYEVVEKITEKYLPGKPQKSIESVL